MAKKKKKAKKAKDPEEEAIEMKRQELILKAQQLTKQIDENTKAKENFFARLEQVKVFWKIKKKNLEEKKNSFQKKDDVLKQMSANHTLQIDIVKEQIKHQLYRKQSELIKFKNAAQVEIYNLKDDLMKGTNQKASKVVEYQSQLKELETSHHDFMVRFQREHGHRVSALHDDFKRKFSEIIKESERNVKSIREEKEAVMKLAVESLQREKDKKTKDVEKVYETKLNQLRVDYNRILHGELDKIEDLKKDLCSKRKMSRQAEKRMKELESMNRSIVVPFTKAKHDLEKLGKGYEEFKVEKAKLTQRKKELKKEDDELKELQWRHEILFQKFQLLQKEFNDTQEEFQRRVLERDQKTAFNVMVLNNKMTELHKTGYKHISSLSKILLDSREEGNSSKCDPMSDGISGKTCTIDTLEGMQSQMQYLHDSFIAQTGAQVI